MSEPDVSTRPYLIRAIYEWCTDQGFTPYLAVLADATVQVPTQYVQDGQIVLNVSASATSGLKMGNDWIEFSARFGGKPHEIMVPVDRVMAIYARENGQGMAFGGPHDVPRDADDEELDEDDRSPAIKLVPSSPGPAPQDDTPPPEPPKGPGRGKLKRIK
ncbi:MAG: ClpXP protease specificity-enhancing factor [Ottowia sp.]|nr:ClpXP protease specificity-enhancing factor [Ottowia sp.]